MKPNPAFCFLSSILLTCCVGLAVEAQPVLHVHPTASGLELRWQGAHAGPEGEVVRPYFELQRSTDLNHWEPIGLRTRLDVSASAGTDLSAFVPAGESHAFFRLLAVEPREQVRLAESSEEVFGYADAFEQELARIGQITPEEFAARYASGAEYLPHISWDPRTGQHWVLFNTDPDEYNQGRIPGVDDVRLTDFRLNSGELSVFVKNGFVVSKRLGSHSFADLFYKLWKDDLPVFISTDAILQAWHRTYDMMVEELEETYLFNAMDRMLAGMAAQIPAAWKEAGDGELRDSLLDADYFLAVARSLLADADDPVSSQLGQGARVASTLAAISGEQLEQFNLFGACRSVDYSQFKVRGHYEHSERLGRYFQCLTWLGRIDFRVAGGPFQDCPDEAPHMATPREMAGALVLWHLLVHSGEFETWLNMDRTMQAFVGWTDSMTFAHLDQLLAAADVHSLADVPDLAAVEELQTMLLAGDLGAQDIRSDFFVSPLGPEQVQLPRSFTVFGQRFTPDSWALSKVVYDDILWTENGVTSEVCRRVPSALDVAFAVLGNNQIVPEIVDRILDANPAASPDPVAPYRDGKPYQHNLAAVRQVVEAQAASTWDTSVYFGWLDTLRTLSAPTTDARYPETMRTRAWAMKTLNTQLASWTQLRHDTILYTKQSYTSGGECSFPAGYVEPRVEFWRRLRLMALRAHELIAGLRYDGEFTFPETIYEREAGRIVIGEITVPLSEVQKHQLEHLHGFADALAILEEISRKELAQQCLDDAEVDFLRDLIEEDGWLPFGGSAAQRTYDGWYPRLFYRKLSEPNDAIFHANRGSDAYDALVADVHTDVPSAGPCDSPGHVLHEGVGRVNLLMIAVESGADRMVLAGPVMSHYEFAIEGPPRRLSDWEWAYEYLWQAKPDEWTKDYLVPVDQSW